MRIHRALRKLPLRLLVVGLAAAAAPAGAVAQESIYRVSGVSVDATAPTASEAREQAIAQAHVEAMQKLLRRLVVDADRSRIPVLSADQVVQYVRDFSVDSERAAAGRYIADFTFRFNPASMRALFQQYGVRFAETQSKPLVVVPLWGSGDDAGLWEEGNPWLAAWSAQRFDEGLVPLVTPLGDLGDVSTITAGQVLSGGQERLTALAQRYQAGGALVAQAAPLGEEAAGTASVGVTTSRFLDGRLTPLGASNFKQQPGEDLAALLARAAMGVAETEEARWRDQNLLDFSNRQTLPVTVPITTLDNWLQIRQRLESLSTVIAATPRTLRRDRVDLDLTFVGGVEQLTRALAQNDLQLSRAVTAAAAYGRVASETGRSAGYGQTAPSGGTSGAYGQAPQGATTGGFGPTAQVQPSWELRLIGAAARGPAIRQSVPAGSSGAANVGVEAVEPLPDSQ